MLTKTQIAIATGRTVFQSTLKDTSTQALGKSEKVIKESTNVKLGKHVTKGKLKGFRIFTVTLEERKTCPSHLRLYRQSTKRKRQQGKGNRASCARYSAI